MTDPEPQLTGLEWRLYVVAALATIYVISWRVLERGGAAPAPTSAPLEASPQLAIEPPRRLPSPRAIWLDDVPVSERPALSPPPGWVVTTRDAAASRPAMQPVMRAPQLTRVPAKRRVRTRSS